MCGIAGIYHYLKDRKADLTILKRMTESIIHRGPDAEGFYCEGRVGLGHRRLSIIDLKGGDQPMHSEGFEVSLIFNGEIYNYIELRSELQGLGCVFKTESDTEVIIRAYLEWGVDFQTKLNGMWAIALFDARTKSLLLSRDRIGEKPIYYGVHDETFLFASEIKALKAFGMPLTVAEEYTELYFSLGYLPDPLSYYREVSKLEPGAYVIVTPEGFHKKFYWSLPVNDEREMFTDEKFVHSRFKELLEDSIRIRMRSDVSFGALLSGGLDSSIITALMAQISDTPINTFSMGFEEREYDESRLAAEVATMYKTKHRLFRPAVEDFDEYLSLVLHHYDEPFGDSSAIPTGIVSKEAAKHVKVVLTGDGGDEVLSGYPSYQSEKLVATLSNYPDVISQIPIHLFGMGTRMFRGTSLGYRIRHYRNAFSSARMDFNERLLIKSSWASRSVIDRLVPGNQYTYKEFLHDTFKQCSYKDPFYQLMNFNIKVSLPGDMLVKVDRMSMAYSLETRAPFIDYRLVEFMAMVHKDVKMKGFERKSVLRRGLSHYLPKSILSAPKKGFRVPVREWFKNPNFTDRLDSLTRADIGLSSKVIGEVIESNRKGESDYGNFLWMLFVYKHWIEKS